MQDAGDFILTRIYEDTLRFQTQMDSLLAVHARIATFNDCGYRADLPSAIVSSLAMLLIVSIESSDIGR